MRLWKNTKETPEGKYLVTRRDGTIPTWPHFVLGARDPAVPHALLAYAEMAEKLGYDPAFVEDVRALAIEFNEYRRLHGEGDADAPPHRKDDPETIQKMKTGQGA
jgi:hypothetical protein